ncbi:hypothetical protein Tco_0025210 [Tanacetum coccineum]
MAEVAGSLKEDLGKSWKLWWQWWKRRFHGRNWWKRRFHNQNRWAVHWAKRSMESNDGLGGGGLLFGEDCLVVGLEPIEGEDKCGGVTLDSKRNVGLVYSQNNKGKEVVEDLD